MRFTEFTGKTVYHCHILDHEDLGMMATLQINA
jgi:FtsP/CotA-like multicopper oxidase with cupredoxin domain